MIPRTLPTFRLLARTSVGRLPVLSGLVVLAFAAACSRSPQPSATGSTTAATAPAAVGTTRPVAAGATPSGGLPLAGATAPASPPTSAQVTPSAALVRADRGSSAASRVVGNFAKPVRFLAFGDSGTGSANQFTVAATMAKVCQAAGCDLVTHLGDIFYPKGAASPADPRLDAWFEKPYAPLGIPFYMSLGNHDYYGNPDAAVAYTQVSPSKLWILPARYHTFLVGGVRFLALDTNDPSQVQETWAKGVLAESRRNGEPWVVAFAHHPRLSYGAHGDADEPLASWLDRVLCHRADLYLAGHDHDKQVLLPRCGVHLVVSGAAAQLRPVGKGPGAVWTSSTLGFAWLQIVGPRAHLRFHDGGGRVEFERSYERTVPEPCLADSLCDAACPADPDCKGTACGKDGKCEVACLGDPDCDVDCPCDRDPLTCEPRQPGGPEACGCDPACQVGVAVR